MSHSHAQNYPSPVKETFPALCCVPWCALHFLAWRRYPFQDRCSEMRTFCLVVSAPYLSRKRRQVDMASSTAIFSAEEQPAHFVDEAFSAFCRCPGGKPRVEQGQTALQSLARRSSLLSKIDVYQFELEESDYV
jgi:hypothetical protein